MPVKPRTFLEELSWSRCGSKECYFTEEKAIGQAKFATERTGTLIEHYKCVDCTGWHIGHGRENEAQTHTFKNRCINCGTPCANKICSSQCHEEQAASREKRRNKR